MLPELHASRRRFPPSSPPRPSRPTPPFFRRCIKTSFPPPLGLFDYGGPIDVVPLRCVSEHGDDPRTGGFTPFLPRRLWVPPFLLLSTQQVTRSNPYPPRRKVFDRPGAGITRCSSHFFFFKEVFSHSPLLEPRRCSRYVVRAMLALLRSSPSLTLPVLSYPFSQLPL